MNGARIGTWPAQAVPQEAAELPHVVAQNVDKNLGALRNVGADGMILVVDNRL